MKKTVTTQVDEEVLAWLDSQKGEGSRMSVVESILVESMRSRETSSGERVMLFLDVSNIQKSIGNGKMDIDFRSLREQLSAGRKLTRAIAFDGKMYEGRNDLHESIAKGGWELNLSDNVGEHQQKEVDMSLGVTLIVQAHADAFDTAIIVTGDRDFVPAIRYVQSLGKRVMSASTHSVASAKLQEACDGNIDIGTLFLIELSSDAEAVA